MNLGSESDVAQDMAEEIRDLRAVVANLRAELEQSRAKALEEAAALVERATSREVHKGWRFVPSDELARAIRSLAEPKESK